MRINKQLVKVGELRVVICNDMSYYAETTAADDDFELVTLEIYGRVVRVTDDAIALAHQTQDDGKYVRHVSVVPWPMVLDTKRLITEG